MARTHVIIVAAGAGSRFGSSLPKQFHPLGRQPRPVLMHTIDAFRLSGFSDDDITVVISSEMTGLWKELCHDLDFTSPHIVAGGETRFHSVRNAVGSLDIKQGDRILVHDGARPLVTGGVISRVTEALNSHSAVVPVVPVTDSIRCVGPDGVSVAVDRAPFRSVQTPQGFDGKVLAEAYKADFSPAFTDDASVVENNGTVVTLVDGDPVNIKITSPRDISVAEALMS